MKIETVRYHFTSSRMAVIKKSGSNSVGKDVEKLALKPSYIGDGNVKCHSQFGEQSRGFSKFDPAIPLLSTYPREMKTHVHTKTWT